MTLEGYIQEFQRTLNENHEEEAQRYHFDLRKVAVRFTGKWRTDGDQRNAKKEAWTRVLNNNNITDVEFLSNAEEARLGSLHSLALVQPYYKNINNFVVIELGGGSHQGGLYQRIEHT